MGKLKDILLRENFMYLTCKNCSVTIYGSIYYNEDYIPFCSTLCREDYQERLR